MSKPPRFKVFHKISEENAEELTSIKDMVVIRKTLNELLNPYAMAEKFALEGDEKLQEKSEIILDFHCNNFEFAQAQEFNHKKLATFLEIMDSIFEKCMAEWIPRDKAMVLFKNYLLRHSIQRPPHSLFVFNLNQVKAITDYVQQSFLKYYAMYQYAIIPKLELKMSHEQLFYYNPPEVQEVEEGEQVRPKDVPDLREYLNEEDLERMATPRKEGEGEEEVEEQQT